MSRTIRLAVAAASLAALALPVSAHADPLCELYWYEDPSVTVHPDSHTVDVNPGHAEWVC